MASKRKMVLWLTYGAWGHRPFSQRGRHGAVHLHTVLAGASFQCFANELNQKALPYHTGKSWNKNMVARILEDSRYVGADLYPPGSYPLNSPKPCRSGRKKNCIAFSPAPRAGRAL